jgi:tetratricopeptide (TPR) repeat protein
VLVQRGRYDEAIADFEAALAIDPRSQDALRFLGLAHSDKGDVPRALQAFERAIAADASDPWPLMIRSITYAREGDRQRALADVERALTLTGSSSSDAFLVRAAVYYFLDDLNRARDDLDTALRLSAANGQAHRLLARLHVREGRLDDADRSLSVAERLMPGDVSVLFVRGLLALARRDYTAAVRSLDASLAINPAHAEGFAARGAAHEGLGNTARAIDDYRTAIGRLATDPESRAAKSRATDRLAALTAPPRPAPRPAQPQPQVAAPPAPTTAAGPPTRPAVPSPAPVETSSAYCRLVEGVFVHSRRYTGVEFDVGCRTDR